MLEHNGAIVILLLLSSEPFPRSRDAVLQQKFD
jgi:hypothetical protein